MIEVFPQEVGLIKPQTTSPGFNTVISPRWEWILLVLILCLAAALRLWRLDSAPPGLTHDEASNGHDAAAVLHGVRPIYFTVGYGHEPLYPYSAALVMAFLGSTDTALRLTTVGWGLTLILLSYGFTRRLFGSLPALLTAAWMAVSFWCVMTSRVGLRAITLAVTFIASAFCFWLASPRPARQTPQSATRKWAWWTLSGVFLGASVYTYMASRATWAVYPLFLVYLFVLRLLGINSEWKRQLAGVVVLLLITVLVAAPLAHFLIAHPEIEQRIGQLSVPLEQATRGDFSGLWRNVSRSLPMFTFRGDPLWLYNIPGRPLLDTVSGALFYAGILVCLWRWRDPRYIFLLIWLIVGASPALVTGPDATVLRSVAVQPVIFIIVALALATVFQFLYRRWGRWRRVAGIGSIVAFVAGMGLCTTHAYFDIWAEHRDVRVAYHHALVQEARYLDAQAEGGTVAFSSIYPGRFHDPYTVEMTLHRDDLALHWFDGRFALVFPSEGESRVIIPAISPLDETLEPIFDEYSSRIHTEYLRPDDLIPRFDVYRFDAANALAAFLPLVEERPVCWSSSDVFPSDEPQAVYEPLGLPVDVGGVIELIGYDLRTPTIEPGEAIEVLTVWRVRASFAPEAIIFTHLLDHNSKVVEQMDRLDVPSWHWQPGDVFVQLHRFPVDASVSPGLYHLEVGIYTHKDLIRLPIIANGVEIDDRVLLQPVEVTSQ
jgi:4-amino-4-deoxy-L-arabinose transferase-like glycosyltransferase